MNTGKAIKGYIHSIETMGTLDGPGTRCVVFMQGCHLRCKYCHNPDTWQTKANESYSAKELLKKIVRYKSYFGKKGGVTVSGGEPLVQAEFVADFFALCKKQNIHTAIDTAGFKLNDHVRKALNNTDMVLLDVKHTDPVKYNELTGGSLKITLDFLDYINSQNIDLWVRQVIVPGYNDTEKDMLELTKILQGKTCLKKIELLAYHRMALDKWKKLGLEYHLKDVIPPDEEKMSYLRKFILQKGFACQNPSEKLEQPEFCRIFGKNTITYKKLRKGVRETEN